MSWPRPRDVLAYWQTWADVGAILFLCWFLLLLVRPQLVRTLQSFLLANRHLLPLLPHGIATPRTVVGSLSWLGIPLAVVFLLVTLLFVSPSDEGELERERRRNDDSTQRRDRRDGG